MFCPNCGQENPPGATLCPKCGQAAASIAAAAPAPRPLAVAKPGGTPRNAALIPLWLLLTANIYWLFWLHKTYKEIRAHTPTATDITPGKAVGFLFIPFFNLYWFLRVAIDMPRAIRRMQQDDSLGDPPLNTGLITGLLIAGIVGNGVMGQVHPALMLLTEPFVIAAFVIAQFSLNAHWERHAAGVAPGQRLAQPVSAAAAALPRELGTLLGVRSPQIEWGAAAAFLAASFLADLVFLLLEPLLRGQSPAPAASWGLTLFADLVLTGAAVAGFRWIRNPAGAAALASLAYTLVQTPVRVLALQQMVPSYHWDPASLLFTLAANFLFLLLLALAVRMIQPLWLGLWIGASVAQLVSSMVYRIASYVQMRMREGYGISFGIHWQDVVTDLAFAAVFAFAFWGGLSLMAPKLLRE